MNRVNRGLFGKYILSKADGKPLDPKARYFVLRYDRGSKDSYAARHAIVEYAKAVADINPILYKELMESLYGDEGAAVPGVEISADKKSMMFDRVL